MILGSCSADRVLLISSTISVSLCWATHVLWWPSLPLWVASPVVTSHWHGWWNPDFSVHQALEMIQQSLLPITPNTGSREVNQRQLSLSFSLWFSVGLSWFPSASSDTSVKVAQSFLTLCDPMDCSLPGSSVLGILQAEILEWVAIPFCRASSQPRDRTEVSHVAGGFFTVWATRKAQTILVCSSFHGWSV